MTKINLIQCVLLGLISLYLAGCASAELKAPCDYQGHFCGQKIHINS